MNKATILNSYLYYFFFLYDNDSFLNRNFHRMENELHPLLRHTLKRNK